MIIEASEQGGNAIAAQQQSLTELLDPVPGVVERGTQKMCEPCDGQMEMSKWFHMRNRISSSF
jgi:hypothetical protein